MNKYARMKKWTFVLLAGLLIACENDKTNKIDRQALVGRNNPEVTEFEELSSLSVGNGNFAYTVDATGLQTFPELYSAGVPLGTQSQWGWHSFPNPENFKPEETLKSYDFRGKEELYAVQFNEPGRQQDAANYYRVNPHRLHLGYVGLELTRQSGEKIKAEEVNNIDQTLDLWNGTIISNYNVEEDSVSVKNIRSSRPRPTGGNPELCTDRKRPDESKLPLPLSYRQSFG
jgi:hypothetical protein